MATPRLVPALRREILTEERIPYAAHVAPSVVRTAYGDYVQAFRLGGASFESKDDDELNGWHERLNVLWRNIAGPDVALWTHVIRHRAGIAEDSSEHRVEPQAASFYADRLHHKYHQRLSNETLMINDVYLSVVHRPTPGLATGLVSMVLAKTQRAGARLALGDALDVCEKLRQTLLAGLERYEPEPLGAYQAKNIWCSSLLEYLALLINGEWQRVPLPAKPINQAIATSRLFFGRETIEYRSATSTRVGGMLGIKEYPTPSAVGMYNRLLSAPFEFVATQSFSFLSKSTGQSLLQRQIHRMSNAGDFAISQAVELKDALDALTSNEFVMGDHHFSLQVLANIADYANGAPGRLKELNDAVAVARSILADTGMLVAREDLALEAAFWAQLPGNFPLRARKAPITSRNFAAMSPFHNFPLGRERGNHWGDALSLFITSARSPYYFSLHASDPSDPDGGSRKDTGHTLICGPTGSGKTVFIGFLVAMLSRQGVTQVIFDKDRGLEILVRALGGDYLPLKNGLPTGFNPLQLPVTPANVEFLKTWLRELSRGGLQPRKGEGTAVREAADLDQALRGTLCLEPAARRLSRLVEFLDPTDPEGLHTRLARWCESHRGEYAWVFDNALDTVVTRLSGRAMIGFDVTEFLDHDLTRAPITLYLFHLIRQLLDGRKLVCWMDEFWRLLADSAFEKFAKDGPKTWRKLDAVMCLATQSPSDVLDSAISRTLVEQTPTKIFFPNSDADLVEYTRGFGLSEREFKLIKHQLVPGSRMFLVKQAHHSVVCRLDLKGFDGELAVISGRTGEVRHMLEIISVKGPDPRAWLPQFLSSHEHRMEKSHVQS
jgi:type IV secretion system protein VirB4